MKEPLESAFASRLEAFLAYKREHGFVYDVDGYIVAFDRMALERFPDETALTKEVCAAWAEPRPGEGPGGQSCRISVLREFARYLAMGGEEAYLTPTPDTNGSRRKRVPCRIFDEDELIAFFAAADSLEPARTSPARHLVVPVYFRFSRCCGTRPGEGRRLRVRDVDLDTGRVFIAESKAHKDRIVMMPDDLLGICRRYHELVDGIFPKREWFFPNANGDGPYSKQWPLQVFNELWEKAGGSGRPGPKPTPYDFRHTFITHRIASWMAEGRDAEALLPLLMDFVGHDNPNDTYYYFHLVPSVFPSLSRYSEKSAADLVPKATDYGD